MITDGVVKSTCGICFNNCGVLIHMANGRITKIKGNPDSPINRGVLCEKGLTSLEYLYHPDRLKHPLKRAGRKGEGQWQRISWDDALGEIASKLMKARDQCGAESVAFFYGTAQGLQNAVL